MTVRKAAPTNLALARPRDPTSRIAGVAAAALMLGGAPACEVTDDAEMIGTAAGGKADQPEGPPTEASGAFDVNDITLLFALKGGRPSPAIAIDDPRLQLSEQIFADVFDGLAADPEYPFDPAPMSSQVQRSDWFIVAARYDPCATPGSARDANTGELDPDVDEACLRVLRLVAQPFPDNEFNLQPDAALHLIYAMGGGAPTAADPAIQILRQLKTIAADAGVTTDGAPLDVHPALVAELAGGETSFADALREGIHALVGSAPLVKIAATSLMLADDVVLADGGGVWAFISGDIADGHWAKTPISAQFTLLDEEWTRSKDFVTCLRGGCTKGACIQTGDDAADCGELRLADRQLPSLHDVTFPLTDDKRAAWTSAAHRIDDPVAFDISDLDCVGCHLTRGTYARFDVHSSPQRRRPPAGITGYGSCNATRGPTWNTRNLGYFESHATVSTRTVLETAFAADFINKRVLGAENPGLDCGEDDDSVWECLMHPEAQPQDTCAASHTAECLSVCASATGGALEHRAQKAGVER